MYSCSHNTFSVNGGSAGGGGGLPPLPPNIEKLLNSDCNVFQKEIQKISADFDPYRHTYETVSNIDKNLVHKIKDYLSGLAARGCFVDTPCLAVSFDEAKEQLKNSISRSKDQLILSALLFDRTSILSIIPLEIGGHILKLQYPFLSSINICFEIFLHEIGLNVVSKQLPKWSLRNLDYIDNTIKKMVLESTVNAFKVSALSYQPIELNLKNIEILTAQAIKAADLEIVEEIKKEPKNENSCTII